MKPWALALLLSAAPPSSAAVVESASRLDAALPGTWSGAALSPSAAAPLAPALTASPAFLSAPALALAPLAAAPLSAPALSPAALPAALVPAAVAPAKFAAALPSAPAAETGPQRPTGERAAFEASKAFDGFGAARGEDDVPAVPAAAAAVAGADADGFGRSSFQSADGLTVAYKHREGPAGIAPRVYSGGLALNESFDPLFARPGAPKRPEYFLWTRGHAPTGWTPTAAPIDGDARDLARMILIASRETGSAKVELALHSFGTLVFQRMVQLRAEPEVAEALKRLSGSRVTLLNATTHYEGSEQRAGREFVQMGQATRGFVDWLDKMDAGAATWEREADQKSFTGEVFRRSLADWRAMTAAAWEGAAGFNPFYARALKSWLTLWQRTAEAADKAADPNEFAAQTIRMMLGQWREQRGQLLTMASKGAASMMQADLKAPWDPAIDPIRRGFVAALKTDTQDRGWQESLLRRSSDMFRLEFTNEDVKAISRMKIRLDLVHATGDQLLNWESARTLFELLGIAAPEKMPEPGTVLTDPTGRFRAFIVAGDHYYPLKRRDDLAARLDP